MKAIIFGATGMIGQGVLRECLRDDSVENVLVIGRSETGQRHQKLREMLHIDFLDFSAVESELTGYDTCFFCLGVSSSGMTEQDYRRITYDYTLAAAQTLCKCNPDMTFIYISGAGTDSTERGHTMWARVKGETENALLKLPFKSAYMFRPGFIQPLHGGVSRTPLYRIMYGVMGPLYPILKRFPKYVTTTEQLAKAMIKVAQQGAVKPRLESEDINNI